MFSQMSCVERNGILKTADCLFTVSQFWLVAFILDPLRPGWETKTAH